MGAPKIFISYSREDRKWAEIVAKHLSATFGKNNVWFDSRIGVGEQWSDEIRIALADADVAVLLLSADFLNSEYITNIEIPAIRKHEKEIVPILLRQCATDSRHWLKDFQWRPSASEPLAAIERKEGEAGVDTVLAGIMQEVQVRWEAKAVDRQTTTSAASASVPLPYNAARADVSEVRLRIYVDSDDNDRIEGILFNREGDQVSDPVDEQVPDVANKYHRYIDEFAHLESQQLKQLGNVLFRTLLQPIAPLASAIEQQLRSPSSRPLRLKIDISEKSDIRRWPLELLRHEEEFLSTAKSICLSRSVIATPKTDRWISGHSPPLKVLVVVNRPEGMLNQTAEAVARIAEWIVASGQEQLGLSTAKSGIRPSTFAGARKSLEVEVMGWLNEDECKAVEKYGQVNRGLSVEMVKRRVTEFEADVLHIFDYGIFTSNGQEGLPSSTMEKLFSNGGRQPRLAVLQYCLATSETEFIAHARRLAAAYAALVATPRNIEPGRDTCFLEGFYRALAEGEEVDAAVRQGRFQVASRDKFDVPDFGVPVLFMQRADPLIMLNARQPADELQFMARLARAALKENRPDVADFILARMETPPSSSGAQAMGKSVSSTALQSPSKSEERGIALPAFE